MTLPSGGAAEWVEALHEDPRQGSALRTPSPEWVSEWSSRWEHHCTVFYLCGIEVAFFVGERVFLFFFFSKIEYMFRCFPSRPICSQEFFQLGYFSGRVCTYVRAEWGLGRYAAGIIRWVPFDHMTKIIRGAWLVRRETLRIGDWNKITILHLQSRKFERNSKGRGTWLTWSRFG